jgi:transposase
MENQEKTKAEIWEERIKKYKRSGLSQRQYCVQNQIPINTFQFWKKKLTKQTAKPTFIKIRNSLAEENHIEIIHPAGVRIILKAEVPEETANALLKTIRKLS